MEIIVAIIASSLFGFMAGLAGSYAAFIIQHRSALSIEMFQFRDDRLQLSIYPQTGPHPTAIGAISGQVRVRACSRTGRPQSITHLRFALRRSRRWRLDKTIYTPEPSELSEDWELPVSGWSKRDLSFSTLDRELSVVRPLDKLSLRVTAGKGRLREIHADLPITAEAE